MVTLKQLLQANKEIDFRIDYISPLQGFQKKDGGTWEAHEVKLVTLSNSEVYDARMFPTVAANFKAGDTVRAFLNAKGYPDFRAVTPGEYRSNTQEVAKERQLAQDKHALEDKQLAKEIQISLQGYHQAHINAGKTNEEALALAVQAREMLLDKVAQMMS